MALEFAMVAMPFFAILFISLNSALMMFCNAVVQGAVATAARQIQTGQMQNINANCTSPAPTNSAIAAFEASVCSNLYGQLPCGGITYDVRTFSSFSAISLPAPSGSTKYCFNTGGSGAIVAVRVIYNWAYAIPGLSKLMGSSVTTVPIQYTIIVKNEPF